MINSISNVSTNFTVNAKKYDTSNMSQNAQSNNNVSFGIDPIVAGLGIGAVVTHVLNRIYEGLGRKARETSIITKHLEQNASFQTAANHLRNKYNNFIRPDKFYGSWFKDSIIATEGHHPVLNKKRVHRIAKKLLKVNQPEAAKEITDNFANKTLQYQNIHG